MCPPIRPSQVEGLPPTPNDLQAGIIMLHQQAKGYLLCPSFERHGFHPDKQVPVSPTDSEAPISVADFAVPHRRVAIYVDGAAFHTGVNLRRDRYIRNRLREGSPPWKVVELTVADLRRSTELIAEIKAL